MEITQTWLLNSASSRYSDTRIVSKVIPFLYRFLTTRIPHHKANRSLAGFVSPRGAVASWSRTKILRITFIRLPSDSIRRFCRGLYSFEAKLDVTCRNPQSVSQSHRFLRTSHGPISPRRRWSKHQDASKSRGSRWMTQICITWFKEVSVSDGHGVPSLHPGPAVINSSPRGQVFRATEDGGSCS